MRGLTPLTTLLVLLLTLYLSVASVTAESDECFVQYVQGDVRICIPRLYEYNTTSYYVAVRFPETGSLEIMIGLSSNAQETQATVELYTGNMTPISSYTIPLKPGNISRVVASIPVNTSVVVYKVTALNETVMGAVVPPSQEAFEPLTRPEFQEPLISLFLALIPASFALSYLLTSDLKEAAFLLFASLPAIYVIASALTAQATVGIVIPIIAVSLIFAIIYYIVHR